MSEHDGTILIKECGNQMSENEDVKTGSEGNASPGNKVQNAVMMKIAVGAVMAVLVGVIAIMGYKLMKTPENATSAAEGEQTELNSGTAIVVSEDTKDALTEIKEKVAKGSIAVKMTQGWIFNDGGKSSNGYLANSERNSYDMRFQIIMEDTGEVIMTSPDVPVGSCIENFPLSVTLEAGTYNVIVNHQLIEDGEVFASVKTAAEIVVNQ